MSMLVRLSYYYARQEILRVWKENVGAVTAQQYVTGEKIVERYGNIMPGSSQKIKMLIPDIHECYILNINLALCIY